MDACDLLSMPKSWHIIWVDLKSPVIEDSNPPDLFKKTELRRHFLHLVGEIHDSQVQFQGKMLGKHTRRLTSARQLQF
jgi:hypothetical protein